MAWSWITVRDGRSWFIMADHGLVVPDHGFATMVAVMVAIMVAIMVGVPVVRGGWP